MKQTAKTAQQKSRETVLGYVTSAQQNTRTP